MTPAAAVVFADVVGKREKGLCSIEQLVSLSELASRRAGVSVRKGRSAMGATG